MLTSTLLYAFYPKHFSNVNKMNEISGTVSVQDISDNLPFHFCNYRVYGNLIIHGKVYGSAVSDNIA